MNADVQRDDDLITPDRARRERWANGLGVTDVLLDAPAWRLSIAEIESSAPFSAMPGIDRVLIPLTRSHIELDIDSVAHRVERTSGTAFAGEARVHAAVTGGPVRVLNVMARRPLARLTHVIRESHGSTTLPDVTATVLLAGRADLDAIALPIGTVLLPTLDARRLSCDGALLAHITVHTETS